jgi:hypothetical protein
MMEEENLQMLKRLETLSDRHRDLDETIASMTSNKLKDEFALHRLKKEKLLLRDEICKLRDNIYPDILA